MKASMRHCLTIFRSFVCSLTAIFVFSLIDAPVLQAADKISWQWVGNGMASDVAIAVDPLGLPWGVGADGKIWADKRSQSIKNVLVDADKALDAAQAVWKKEAAANLKKIAAANAAKKKAEAAAGKKAAALAKAVKYTGPKPPKGYILTCPH